MCSRSKGGFTVIEVTLFLAISGLLLTVAMIGTGITIRSIRYSDSMRSLHSFVQKQYDEIINGVNSRAGAEACANSQIIAGSDKPGASKCLLLGKMIKFTKNSSTIQTFLIVGSEPPSVNFDSTSDKDLIVQYTPSVLRTVQNDTYDIPWQAKVTDMKRVVDKAGVDTYALIRSPRSSTILSYTFKDDGSTNISTLLQATNSLAKKTNICVKSADNLGNVSEITVGEGQGQDSVILNFDVNESAECTEGV